MTSTNESTTGLTPDEKSALNEEGFEGGAAVLVGKKSEVEQARQRLEAEGRAADLETFIRAHKEVFVSREWLEKNKIDLSSRVGQYFLLPGEEYEEHGPLKIIKSWTLRYVDSQGNFVEVEIKPDLIDEIGGERQNGKKYKKMNEELERLGFNGKENNIFSPLTEELSKIANKYEEFKQKEAEESQRNRDKKKFDF